MKVSDILVKKILTIDEDSTLATALNKMQKYKVHQLPVVSDELLTGMVVLKDLLKTQTDPSETLVREFSIKVTPLSPDTDLEESIIKVINSGLRALPVAEGLDLLGMVSESDLIKHIDVIKEANVENVIGPTVNVKDDDSIGKAISLMVQYNIGRLPVVNWEGKLVGVLNDFDLVLFFHSRSSSIRFSPITGVEKGSLKDFLIKDYMHPHFAIEKKEFSLKKIVDMLQKHDEVVVTEGQKPVGLITPKDVLELARFGKRYPVYVSHLRNFDPFDADKFQEMLASFMGKFEKILTIQKFFVYADVYREHGDRRKYSLRARLLTNKRTFLASSYAWSLSEAAKDMLSNLERQLMKEHNKHTDKSRAVKRRLKNKI